jgi:hypothetical protein
MCSSHSKDLKEIEKGFCSIETLIECFEAAVTVRSILAAMVRVLAG